MEQTVEPFKHPILTLPITALAHRTAYQFATAQPTPAKATQVYLNTLAVWIINDYFQMFGIPTALEQSDSWHPVTRMMADVADLYLPDIGQLECRPVRTNAVTCSVPTEVQNLRLGYVVVELDEPLESARLLGFVPSVTDAPIVLSELKSLDHLLEHLHGINPQQVNPCSSSTPLANVLSRATQDVVRLNQWLQGDFEAQWQAVDTLLPPNRLALAYNFRQSDADLDALMEAERVESEANPDVRRAKLIDLGSSLETQPVVLVLALETISIDTTKICVQVHPYGNHSYVCPGLELAVLESSGTVFTKAQARHADNCIQVKCTGTVGESFTVRLTFQTASYVESFMLG